MIIFEIKGEVAAKGRPRISTRGGFVRSYTPAKTRNFEATVRMLAQQAMHGRPPFDVAVMVDILVIRAIPASFSKAKKALSVYPTTKPDIDNTIKGILDGMNTVVYTDDKLICGLNARKVYGTEAKTTVTVGELDG